MVSFYIYLFIRFTKKFTKGINANPDKVFSSKWEIESWYCLLIVNVNKIFLNWLKKVRIIREPIKFNPTWKYDIIFDFKSNLNDASIPIKDEPMFDPIIISKIPSIETFVDIYICWKVLQIIDPDWIIAESIIPVRKDNI